MGSAARSLSVGESYSLISPPPVTCLFETPGSLVSGLRTFDQWHMQQRSDRCASLLYRLALLPCTLTFKQLKTSAPPSGLWRTQRRETVWSWRSTPSGLGSAWSSPTLGMTLPQHVIVTHISSPFCSVLHGCPCVPLCLLGTLHHRPWSFLLFILLELVRGCLTSGVALLLLPASMPPPHSGLPSWMSFMEMIHQGIQCCLFQSSFSRDWPVGH